jgi:RNA polymerase sigma-70 factor (ECF subfamily)
MRNDAELLRADDASAFRELYDRYAGSVHGFHLKRCRDEQAAHDLTAETFAQAWLSRRRFRDEAQGVAGPWLFGIARNVLLTSVRRGRLEQQACERLGLLDALDRPAQTTPEEAWIAGIDDVDVLKELPWGQRDALELRVVHDLDYAEVARRLDTTPAAARVRVTRALAALRNQMTREETT